MTEQQVTIERLPEETQSKLRSTQILTSLPQIVSELLQNALDAKATHIDIGADCKEWTCWVRDNGSGISKEGLEQLGQGEGSRYNTSKTYAAGYISSLSTFGFRGEALASAGDIACLEICSRTAKSRNTFSVIIKGGKQLYLGPAVRWNRECAGTTVCVRDIFYNVCGQCTLLLHTADNQLKLPVRRRSHPNASRTWELLRQEMETYALVFPHVSFSLDDTSDRGDSLQRRQATIIRIPKSLSTLNSFRHLYGHALTEHIEEIKFTSESTTIEGFISLTGASSKTYQFLYINRHPITMTDFGRVIDSEFSCSSFGKNALNEEGNRDLPRSSIRRSPRKLEKKPVYVLNITVAPEEVDNCVEPNKAAVKLRNQSDVLFCLRQATRQFLERHGFQCRNNIVRPTPGLSRSPRKRSKVDYQHIDDSGYAEDDSVAAMSALSFENGEITPPPTSNLLHISVDAPAEEIVWQDPSTGERFVVDSRTGHSFQFPETHVRQTCNEEVSTSNTAAGQGRRTLRQRIPITAPISSSSTQTSPIPQWIERALQSNQAYAISENRIPSLQVPPRLDPPVSRLDPFQRSGHVCHHPQDLSAATRFRVNSIRSGSDIPSFSKEDLRHATIIGQVDRKFIACRIALPVKDSYVQDQLVPSIIVLVDQHAADERVRVERFLKELCFGVRRPERGSSEQQGPHVRQLVPPRPVLLTEHEALRILQSMDVRQLFLEWGVRFVEGLNGVPDPCGDSDSGRSNGYSQLLVSTIPEIVCDKLLQGDELRDFIKGFLGQIQSGELLSDSQLAFPSEGDPDEVVWLKAVRRCPRGLLDLINSKACRGAIMFNDTLSVFQCQALVKQLSETAFPFQCAHGRPSLISLIETGVLRKNQSRGRKSEDNWARLETMEES